MEKAKNARKAKKEDEEPNLHRSVERTAHGSETGDV